MDHDRSVIDAARKFTSQLQELKIGTYVGFGGIASADICVESEQVSHMPNTLKDPDTPNPQSKYISIGILSLSPLLDAIRADFPKWDGTSSRLVEMFQERNFDPRIRYERFYSTDSADFFASYAWSGRSLSSIAG